MGAAGRIVIGVTGASGLQYAVTLLEHYPGETHLVVSKDALQVLRHELDIDPAQLKCMATAAFENEDWTAPAASGSAKFDAVVVVPCSMNTMAKVAMGVSDNLITRAATVALKEKRKLILVPRETPLSEVHLENMLKVARLGATILPAMPGFYNRPQRVQDLVDFVVARILDHLGVDHNLGKRWGEGPR